MFKNLPHPTFLHDLNAIYDQLSMPSIEYSLNAIPLSK
jgi:hypothetical protein